MSVRINGAITNIVTGIFIFVALAMPCIADSQRPQKAKAPASISPQAQAEFDKAITALEAGSYETALSIFQKLAKAGNANARFKIGIMYERGLGVKKDDADAYKWYLQAAKQGHAEAQLGVGLMYKRGRGVSKDDAEALKWLRRSAEQGHANAQATLGFMYETGYENVKVK